MSIYLANANIKGFTAFSGNGLVFLGGRSLILLRWQMVHADFNLTQLSSIHFGRTHTYIHSNNRHSRYSSSYNDGGIALSLQRNIQVSYWLYTEIFKTKIVFLTMIDSLTPSIFLKSSYWVLRIKWFSSNTLWNVLEFLVEIKNFIFSQLGSNRNLFAVVLLVGRISRFISTFRFWMFCLTFVQSH